MQHPNINLVDGVRGKKIQEEIPVNISERNLYKGKVKYMDMADLRLEGNTLVEIGKKYKLTRERIRQILKKYFFDLEFPDLRAQNSGRRITRIIKKRCKACKKPLNFLAYKHNKKRTFHNWKCFRKFYKIKDLPIPVSKMTKAQFRVYNNQRTKNYYHKHKNDPVFKERIKNSNRKYALKHYGK